MYRKFNDWLGDKLAFGLSTMEACYIVTAFVVIPLFFQRPHDLIGWVQFLVQSFFQGSSLPLLGYVSRKSGERQERLLQETHDAVMKELKLIRQEFNLMKKEKEELEKFLQDLKN